MAMGIDAGVGMTSHGEECASKEARDVGIKNFRDFNMTLLCKWLWRFGAEDSGL